MIDYKRTLCLPQTRFPMKANLTQNEPQTLKFWESIHAYDKMVASNMGQPEFVLHDGPPYANGHIHLGTALNKILKDICVKSRNLQGIKAQYVPGWDCHGLPIELKVEQELGEKKRELPAHVVRKKCRDYALKYLDIQRKEFKRLGVWGTWDHPYMTIDPSYEAATAREFVNFMENDAVIRSKKPIYWCSSCQTALAEAEVEYDSHTSPSVYVRFPLADKNLAGIFPAADPERTYVVIWTTTPWTLPANLAIALNPDIEYALIRHKNDCYIMAKDLVSQCALEFGWDDYILLGTAPGSALEGLVARHPFYNRPSPLCLGSHVTLDAGTGCVHTAPGHGREDYEVGLAYNLDIYSPLSDDGRFLESVEFFSGQNIFEANPQVIKKLEETGHLLAQKSITHSYPHCWRCKKPVIFRATTQWFISMDRHGLRKKALDVIRNNVEWIPAWGEERIYNMIESRPDWCVSRQRLWGVPIIALICEKCGEAWFDSTWAKEIVEQFAHHKTGCDYWFETDLDKIVPPGLECPHCHGGKWRKETDILDVWFDSGSSWAAVLEQRPECRFPADLYLEGSDQHRGWFHSSLLIALGTRNEAPYRAVLTHGYVVDGEGKKMSKSLGNVIAPSEIIDKYGAEILRMWVSSVEYREDIRISQEILSRLVDAYRRIRNTARYLLGNISDLSPEQIVPFNEMEPLDQYALDIASRTHERVQQAYSSYEFHKAYHLLHNLCVTDLSAFYLDILKDRLYCSSADSHKRKSAQSAILNILMLLMRDIAPILSFTAEEIFAHLPDRLRPQKETVFALGDVPPPVAFLSEEERKKFDRIVSIRNEVSKAIEPLRKTGAVGHSLDTRVTLFADEHVKDALAGQDMRSICIVSQFEALPYDEKPKDVRVSEEIDGLAIDVQKASGEKCERCWIYSDHLGSDAEYPTLCPRCTQVLKDYDKE